MLYFTWGKWWSDSLCQDRVAGLYDFGMAAHA